MGTITKLRLGYRVLFVIIVILLVDSPEDVFLIPVIEGVGSLAAGLYAMYLAISKYGLRMGWPGIDFIKREVIEGASVFISYMAVHFYTTINVVLLGIMVNSVAVAQYSIAEKVYFAIRGMLGPFVQALFPSLSRLYEEDFQAFKQAARKIAIVFFAGLIGLALIMYFIAEPVVLLISGQSDHVSTQVLQFLAVALIFALGTYFSPLLVIQKKRKLLVWITFLTLAVNMVIVFPLVYFYGVLGMAAVLVISQLFQTAAQLVANASVMSAKTVMTGSGKIS